VLASDVMDPKRDGPSMLSAPSARGEALAFPPPEHSRRKPPPHVDEHIVTPETTRDEMIRGEKFVALPALAPHADQHMLTDFVLIPHLREGYVGSTDLLTRVSEGSDFATDASVRKEGIDPATGGRYLEELSFEIVKEQNARVVSMKAAELIGRGVRRFFAINVKRREVREWVRIGESRWVFEVLEQDGVLEDPCFVRPIPIRALLDMKAARSEVVHALESRGEPEILALKERAEQEGLRHALRKFLTKRFGPLDEATEARIAAATPDSLDVWLDKAATESSLASVFSE